MRFSLGETQIMGAGGEIRALAQSSPRKETKDAKNILGGSCAFSLRSLRPKERALATLPRGSRT
jgi:hypothetical protein